jgi:hypothetical protein
MHAAMIPHCTVVFCMLQNATELQDKFSEEIFQLLNLMFCEFDDAVNRHGMFKYQPGECRDLCRNWIKIMMEH